MNAAFQNPPRTPLRAVEYDLAHLDEGTRKYLKAIRDTRGKGCNGAYVGRGSWWPGICVALGLGLIAWAIYLTMPQAFSSVVALRDPFTLNMRTGLLTAGALFFCGGLVSLWRRRRENYLGNFLFVDGQYLWDVNPCRVRVTPIHTVREARGTHHHTNGSYNYTAISLAAPEGGLNLQIANRAQAEDVVMFLNACAHLRANNQVGLGSAFDACPELLADLARRILDNRLSDGGELGKSAAIPQPTGPAPTGFFLRNAPLGMAVAAALLIGLFALPPLSEYWADEHRFAYLAGDPGNTYRLKDYLEDFPQGRHAAEVQNLYDDARFSEAQANPNFDGLEQYLAEFPQGRHATEAQNELDDRRWTLAETNATSAHSPAALRDYLADQRNTRHLADAQALIDGFYDEAIARIKTLSEGQESVDPQLASGLRALLESLKTSPRPVVKIGFAARRDLEPQDELIKLLEAREYAAYLDDNPSLKEIENASANHTAILPLGEVFSDAQVQRREGFILDRLREAIHKVLDADIIAFEAAAEGETPAMTIEYHSYPVGGLYLYTRTQTSSFGTESTSARGLLRGYVVDWSLAIRPRPEGETFAYTLASKPGESLYYRPEASDPDWAVYAIIMYSAFHDFSGKLISGFGLEAPTPPVSFSFADATGSNDASPRYVPSYDSNDSSNSSFPTSDPANPWGLPHDASNAGMSWGNAGNGTFSNNLDPNYLYNPPANTTNPWNNPAFNSPLYQRANDFAREAFRNLNDANGNTLDNNGFNNGFDSGFNTNSSNSAFPENLLKPQLDGYTLPPSLFDSTAPAFDGAGTTP